MITLQRTSKITGKVKEDTFVDFEEMEERLSKISTSHYNIADYSVVTTNFEELEEFFKSRYNPNYYTIDDLMGIIYIHKLAPSEKRNLFFRKTHESKGEVQAKAIERLRKRYDLTFDEDLQTLEIRNEGNVVKMELKNFFTVDNFTFEEVNVENVKDMSNVVNYIVKYFERISERYKIKGT